MKPISLQTELNCRMNGGCCKFSVCVVFMSELCGIKKQCTLSSTLQNDIMLFSNSYRLCGLTFSRRGHYNGATLINRVWHHNDGLWERNCKGSALGNLPHQVASCYHILSTFVKSCCKGKSVSFVMM